MVRTLRGAQVFGKPTTKKLLNHLITKGLISQVNFQNFLETIDNLDTQDKEAVGITVVENSKTTSQHLTALYNFFTDRNNIANESLIIRNGRAYNKNIDKLLNKLLDNPKSSPELVQKIKEYQVNLKAGPTKRKLEHIDKLPKAPWEQ